MAASPTNERHHGEICMESFIRHQMTVILQPFIDEVQGLASECGQLTDRLNRTDANLANTQQGLEATNAEVSSTKAGLRSTDARVDKAHEGLKDSYLAAEALQQGLEYCNGFAQRLQNQLESTSSLAAELQRGAGESDLEVSEIKARLQRATDELSVVVGQRLDQMTRDVLELKAGQSTSTTLAAQIRGDLDESRRLLQDTRRALEQNNADTAGLRKTADALQAREAHLGCQLQDWKNQWAKLHPGLDALRRDAAALKQLADQHGASLHGLQQSNAHTFQACEGLRQKHDNLHGEVQTLQQGLVSTQRSLQDAHDGLDRQTAFGNNLHTSLQRTDAEAVKAGQRADGLESRQSQLIEAGERTSSAIADLNREQRKGQNDMQALQLELEKTNSSLRCASGLLDAQGGRLQTLRADLGKTTDTVNRVDSGFTGLTASFSGLQKGFRRASDDLSARGPITMLPKLGKEAPKFPRNSPRVGGGCTLQKLDGGLDLTSPTGLRAGSWAPPALSVDQCTDESTSVASRMSPRSSPSGSRSSARRPSESLSRPDSARLAA